MGLIFQRARAIFLGGVMKPEGNRERDSDNNITQLLQLLRKIISSQFKNGAGLPDIFSSPQKNQSINLNVCLFSFFHRSQVKVNHLDHQHLQPDCSVRWLALTGVKGFR